MHQSLIQAQELGDEKMQIVNHMQEIIDGKLRQLDTDQQNLDLKEDRDRYALLDDGTPSKLQRLQSPMREQGNQAGTGNGGLNGNGLLSAKDLYALGGYAGGVVPGSNAMTSGNGGGSTPNSERSSHVSNGGNSGSNGNASGGGGGELQRTGSKRSRRRNESVVNNGSSLEMGGNESNSANEASGSGGGSGERKSSLGGASGAGQGRKASLQSASGSLASGSAATSSGAAGGGGASGAGVVGGNNSGKKKKRKVRGSGASNANASTREETPPPETIDPDEPTYCVCNQVSSQCFSYRKASPLITFSIADLLWRDDPVRQWPVPHRVVPFFVRLPGTKTKRQVVLPQLPRRTAKCNETQGAVPQRTGALQQGKGGEDLVY